MESSPLIKAHDHARAASNATQTADTTTAITEHALAAGEFSNAAKSTTSVEALRTLHLLEQHHKRLSELLKLPLDTKSQQSSAEGDIPEEDEKDTSGENDGTSKSSKPSKAGSTSTVASHPTAKPVPTLPHPRRYPGRELSSSIASNLASARGIKSKYRGQPLIPSVSNDQAPGSLEVRPRRDGPLRNKASDPMDSSRKPSWIPPTQQGIKEDALESSKTDQANPAPSQSEEGFYRFYSTFGSLINKLSAPLAFAGLPLIAEDTVPEASPPPAPTPEPVLPKRSRPKSSATTAGPDPELSKIFSRATLRALARDGHGGDSFYVVPTSGHTASYASILNHENKEKRRMAASIHEGGDPSGALGLDDDDDDFVDAREMQVPLISPGLSSASASGGFRKRFAPKSRSERELQNVVEELHTENAGLKEMLDKLSKRLHAFELNSQSTHLALAQSIRLQRPGSPMSFSSGGAVGSGADEALKKRNRELEEQLATVMSRVGVMEKDYDKLQGTVDKYRERWEKLKAGAKARREAQDSAAEGDSAGRSGR
ncbi:hypothetical protein B0T25DRAFT_215713 [Lasiosphaeria hispida]|uniref:Uncharacterized protein n=1 Tax=Lasiosphaeria hispida TaxID=260671 RepID=A0AAJ0HJL8_9PEZI|nr:hypothetical protein B0T25DRAFT_215713 [Lasiosphaeria hispida]